MSLVLMFVIGVLALQIFIDQEPGINAETVMTCCCGFIVLGRSMLACGSGYFICFAIESAAH